MAALNLVSLVLRGVAVRCDSVNVELRHGTDHIPSELAALLLRLKVIDGSDESALKGFRFQVVPVSGKLRHELGLMGRIKLGNRDN